jgi:hypothetical protein
MLVIKKKIYISKNFRFVEDILKDVDDVSEE